MSWKAIEDIKDKRKNTIIPIGHASFLIYVNGVRLLTDLVVVANYFMKRYTKVPFHIPELDNVDYLLLSHNHRDYIDKKSVQKICTYNPQAIILTGLGVGKILQSWGIKNQIQEAGWHQQFKTSENITINYLSSQHWYKPWLTDTNINL